ncbi:MAG: glycosyltransferase family 1 protein [bacterium]|nr:glycosyltransferase family 1 protein [bacterium]
MRIGIDLQCLPTDQARELTGISNYAYLLSIHLLKLGAPHKFIFFLPKGSPFRNELISGGGEIIELPAKKIPFYSTHVLYSRIMSGAKLDMLHGPANTLPLFYPFQTPLRWITGAPSPRQERVIKRTTQSVITLHDLVIYKHPKWFPGGQWFSKKIVVPRSIREADKIIVPSKATAEDLMELFHVPSFKVSAIPHGVEERFFRKSVIPANAGIQMDPRVKPEDDKEKYILFVGTVEPRKNLARLVQAYASLPQDILDRYDLVIAGQTGWKYEEIENAKLKMQNDNSKLKNKIKVIGYVSENELPTLLQNASLFVFPSLYEGFGLPVLEAMAAGVPVITSNTSSMPEVVADAGLLVNPYSVAEITNAIVKIIRDSVFASRITRAGTRRAGEFSWDKTARTTLEIYDQ